jgi:hypothetical protein
MRKRLVRGLAVLIVCALGTAVVRYNVPTLRSRWNRHSTEYGKLQDDRWKERIQEQLGKRISFDFVDTPLPDVVSFLPNLTDTTIVLDPTVVRDNERPVTLKVSDMRFYDALNWILRLADLVWDFKDEAIYISTREKVFPPVRLTYAYSLKGKIPPPQYDELLRLLGREVPPDADITGPRSCIKIFGDILVIHRMGQATKPLLDILDAMGLEPVKPPGNR